MALRSGRSLAALYHRLVPGERVLMGNALRNQHFCTVAGEEDAAVEEEKHPEGFSEEKHPQGFSEEKHPQGFSEEKHPKGFSPGIFKAIIIGRVGHDPVTRTIARGIEVVNFALVTGGMRNNRRALAGESTTAYAERSFTQLHRVCVFNPSLLGLAKQLKKGLDVYVEGNLESRLYRDAVTGRNKLIREVSVRQSGRLYTTGSKLLPGYGRG